MAGGNRQSAIVAHHHHAQLKLIADVNRRKIFIFRDESGVKIFHRDERAEILFHRVHAPLHDVVLLIRTIRAQAVFNIHRRAQAIFFVEIHRDNAAFSGMNAIFLLAKRQE